MSKYEKLLNTLEASQHTVFLTGAGVSTDSGIPDFQTTDKNWKHETPRLTAFSRQFFYEKPEEFWRIYWEEMGTKLTGRPNRFHYFIASLAKRKNVSVITQNVDGLHTGLMPSNVLEYHGNASKAVCSRKNCPAVESVYNLRTDRAPQCLLCGRYMRPDIVLYGEKPRQTKEAASLVRSADVLVVAGTSLDVLPFAQLPTVHQTVRPGGERVWLNKDAAPADVDFTQQYQESFEDLFSHLRVDAFGC